MGLIRLLLIVLMTLTASVCAAMDGGHATALEHDHTSPMTVADDHPVCCSDSTERMQNCHVLPALVPASDFGVPEPVSCGNMLFGSGLLLTGIEPSGPLNPPRAV